jgi:hypothetical protein
VVWEGRSCEAPPYPDQKMMRHSSLELTARYTRYRAADFEAAAAMLPSLKPNATRPEAMVATGTHGAPINDRFAISLPYTEDASGRFGAVLGDLRDQVATVLMMANSAENKGISGESDRKAPPGFEPGMEVFSPPPPPMGALGRRRLVSFGSRKPAPGGGKNMSGCGVHTWCSQFT